jgi:hypothetical protein
MILYYFLISVDFDGTEQQVCYIDTANSWKLKEIDCFVTVAYFVQTCKAEHLSEEIER